MLKKRNLLLIIVILIITMGFSLFALKGQITKETSESKPTPTITKETLSKIRETFPVVEHSKASSLEKENPKSKKYNEALRVLSLDKDIPKNLESFSAHHWEKGLTALPIEKSDVVILGKVIDAKAHLSPDKSTVYSEFKIEIEEVFKNNSHLGFENGKYIRAERDGGIVRYPSGNEFWHFVLRQQMPRIGGRYVFFLTHDFPLYGQHKQDLYLLTGYELKEGEVFPLDNLSDSHPLVSVYKGRDESILLNDLRDAFKHQ